MHLWSIAAALTLAVVAAAQTPAVSHPTMVRPIPGVPISVESIEQYVTKKPDGTSSSGTRTIKFLRDDAGRMRIEMQLPQAFGDPVLVIQIANPVDGYLAILETPARIAHRITIPKAGGIAMSLGPNGLAGVSGSKTRKNEDLGKQTIEGMEFTGSRTTTTSDEQPTLVAVDELWMSTELGLLGLVKHTGPDGETTSRIQHTDRTAPDPKLFVIPDDYRIREMTP